jgi:hypothetical protein
MYSEPSCQIRSCAVASANASLSSWISARCRLSTRLPRLPGLARHAIFHRRFASVEPVAPPVDRPGRHTVTRAASATVISCARTARTSCSRVSTGTGSLLLLKIELPVTVRREKLPESLTHTKLNYRT